MLVSYVIRKRKQSTTYSSPVLIYSSYIWTLCKLKLGIISPVQNLNEEAASIKLKFKNKDKCYYLARLVLCGAVWHIWHERNRRIFQQQQMSKIMLFRRMYEDIHFTLKNCKWKDPVDVFAINILSNWS